MKKTHKRILGFLGLSLVVVTTFVAAAMPSPETSATSTITDVLRVRVVGSTPDVNIDGIINEKIYTDSSRPFTVSHENVETLTVSLRYTDLEGNNRSITLDEAVPDYEADEKDYTVVFKRMRERD